MSRNGQALVDGRGTDRVLNGLGPGGSLDLRHGTLGDAKVLWRWANDPETRRNSFSKAAIPWEAHRSWLKGKLKDPSCSLYIGEEGGRPLGQVRLDRRDGAAVISVSVAPEHRGAGRGVRLIREGCRRFFKKTGTSEVLAYVKPSNVSSRKAFERAG